MLKKYFFSNPRARIKQLQIGIGIFALGLCILYVSAHFEWQWLFYLASAIMGLGILVVLPAYIAFLLWRLSSNMQNNTKD